MSDTKTHKPGRLEALVAKVEAEGPLHVSVLASSALPTAGARRAAEELIGAIASQPGRVGRLASLLDNLCAADAAKQSNTSKRRYAHGHVRARSR